MFAELLEGLKSLVLGPNQVEQERREIVRLDCDYPVTVELCGEPCGAARVIELSPAGLRLEGSGELKVATAIHLRLSDSLAGGKVVWCRRHSGGWRSGVLLTESAGSWVEKLLQEVGFDENIVFTRRRHPRMAGAVPARASDSAEQHVEEGWVSNLGVGGALLRFPRPLPEDRVLDVRIGPSHRLPALSLQGTVLKTWPDPDEQQLHHNFRFLDPDADQVKLLGRYIFALLKESSR
ncbi:MAG: PilZ domain-containing protein [Armatimonadetes bacterium]|nr:PilZ domain-containing protein [Armatimonadota bacterium]